ncbi:FAD-dependent oxidoreductase [Candidatus Daviesbacteria bacterium]|nr:FAD-dependent oxidoreductase [Candidatus Daviesbacteria bacterium]
MQGKIIDKKEIAKATLQVTFEIPDEQFTFKPGQYAFITLVTPPYPDERSNKRHFSIVNSPNQKHIITIATRIRDSGFKKSLQELPNNSLVEIGPIAGGFILPSENNRPLVFIAGGIGITPFISMLSYIKEEHLPYQITLIYSNRDQSSAAYVKELQELARTLPNFRLILTMTEDTSWVGENRRVDVQLIKDYTKNLKNPLYFVVGPPAMVDAIQKTLLEAGVNPENINIENFTGY